jgi:hypothetical protein
MGIREHWRRKGKGRERKRDPIKSVASDHTLDRDVSQDKMFFHPCISVYRAPTSVFLFIFGIKGVSQ